MRLFRQILLLITTAVLIAACQEKEPTPLIQPDGYLKLCKVYRNGDKLVEVKYGESSTTLVFEQVSLELMTKSIPVNVYTSNGPKIAVSSSTGTWYVNGINTQIPNQEGKYLEEAYPVHVYMLKNEQGINELHMVASNKEHIIYPNAESAEKPDDDDDGKGEEENFIPGSPANFQMPKIYITHWSDRVHSSYYVDASITIKDADKHYSDIQSLTSTMQIKGHGNSTWGMPKQPYRIKLTEEQRVLGMPKNRDWVFLANYADKSLLRNATAMKMSEMAGMDWTPRYRNVEVYLNNSYVGVYNIFEAKEVTKNKVNIDLDAGDMYLEIEQSTDEPHYFTTSKCGVPIQFKEPNEPSAADEQMIKDFFKNFESALYSSSYTNPSTGYAKYIDVDSFINNYIIEELAKDIDGNVRKSSFLVYEAKTQKIKFYHEWDFDLCFGNADYFPSGLTGSGGDNNGPKGWWIKDYNTNSWKGDSWYNRLFKDPSFVNAVQSRWEELYPTLKLIPGWIDLWVAEMGDAPARNFKTWAILGTYVWPNVKVTGSYAGEVDWLKDFYTQRLEWINDNIYNL